MRDQGLPGSVTPVAFLGAAAIALMTTEATLAKTVSRLKDEPSRGLGSFSVLYAYMERRNASGPRTPLPHLPVPEEFKQVFLDWAEGKVNFIGPATESTSDA
jgi:hypothetical protein